MIKKIPKEIQSSKECQKLQDMTYILSTFINNYDTIDVLIDIVLFMQWNSMKCFLTYVLSKKFGDIFHIDLLEINS